MIQSVGAKRTARVKKHLDDMVKHLIQTMRIIFIGIDRFLQRRIEEVEQRYYYATLGDKESNPFSLGIAVRFPYGEFDIRTTEPQTEKVQIGRALSFSEDGISCSLSALRYIRQRNVRIADWIYCNSTAEDDIGDTEESFRGYLKEKIETKRIVSCESSFERFVVFSSQPWIFRSLQSQ